MKVLLSGPIQRDAEIQNWGAPCLGIMRIAEYLRFHEETVDVIVYDSQIDRFDPIELWKDTEIDVLGVSLLHYTLFDTLVFLKKFRKDHPNTLIVLGGNEAGANYQEVFEKSTADVIVMAEGEAVFLDIVRWKMGKQSLENIKGIIFRKFAEPITNNDLWSFWRDVDFSRYRYEEYWKQLASMYENPDYEKIKYVRLMTVSHCQRGCTFCSLPPVRTKACGQIVGPVSLTGEQIMELVDKIHVQLPDVRTLYLCTDDVFYPSRTPFLAFMQLYKRSGYDYRILIQTSTYSIQESDFPLLRSINCQHITLGFENCSEAMRKSLHKPQKIDKMEQIIQWGIQYGISIYVLIILIPPEATMKDLIINYETISDWVLNKQVQVSVEPVMYPYRGAPIFEMGSQFHYDVRKESGVTYRDASWIIPNDPEVASLCEELQHRRGEFLNEYYKRLNHVHRFKGSTGVALISLLGQMLRERGYSISKGL